MSRNSLVQVELAYGNVHTVTWVDADLRPVPGMVLLCARDTRRRTVVAAYTRTPVAGADVHSDWRVGGL